MRPTARRLLLGLGLALAAPALSILTPTAAHADTCYTVQVGDKLVTVCP